MKRKAKRIRATSEKQQPGCLGEQSVIHFYRANEKPSGVFSNLFRRPIVFEAQTFPTAEHAYQAGKPRKDSVRAWILSAPTPNLVAMAAHGLYTWDIVPHWSQIKFDRMKRVLQAKFTQHSDFREILLSTGQARLVESATADNAVNRTWGEVNGKGMNMLGQLLMEVREELVVREGVNYDPLRSLPFWSHDVARDHEYVAGRRRKRLGRLGSWPLPESRKQSARELLSLVLRGVCRECGTTCCVCSLCLATKGTLCGRCWRKTWGLGK